jgi:hypothetical protein
MNEQEKEHARKLVQQAKQGLSQSIDATLAENKDILDKLGSDFDENGVPYWWKSQQVSED